MDRFQPAVRPTTGSHRVAVPIKSPSPELAMKATTLSSFRPFRRVLALLAGLALAQAASAQQTLSLNLSASISSPDIPDRYSIDPDEPAWGLDPTNIWQNEKDFRKISPINSLQGSGVAVTTSSDGRSSSTRDPHDTGWSWVHHTSQGSWTVTLSNLNQYFPNGYFIYGYVAGSTNRQLNVSASYGGTTTGTIYTTTATIASADEYQRITSTDPDNPTRGGNYFQYGEAGAGLAADTVTLHMSTNSRAGLGALQIVAADKIATPETPLSVNLSASGQPSVGSDGQAWGVFPASNWLEVEAFTSSSPVEDMQGTGVSMTTTITGPGDETNNPENTAWRWVRGLGTERSSMTINNLARYFGKEGYYLYLYYGSSYESRYFIVSAAHGSIETPYIYANTTTASSVGDYQKAESYDARNPAAGNYVQIGGPSSPLTAETITLNMFSNGNVGIGGFQIVPANLSPTAPLPPIITRVGFNDSDDFEVEAGNLQSGTTYTLQRAADLSAEASFDHEADSATPAGETHTFTDEDPPEDKAFYRLSTE